MIEIYRVGPMTFHANLICHHKHSIIISAIVDMLPNIHGNVSIKSILITSFFFVYIKFGPIAEWYAFGDYIP